MDELMKQIELTRYFIENKKTISLNESSSKNICYAEAVKLSPFVSIPTLGQTLSKDQINEKVSQALDNIKLAKAKNTEKQS